MYARTYEALGQTMGRSGLGQCDPGSAAAMTHQTIIDTIKCELQRPFRSLDDPRLYKRRLRLRELFNAVPPSKAMELYDQLDRTDDPLAQLFHDKLHTATRKELVAILGRRFFKEYELRFNTLDDRFSIDSNPDPTLDKAGRKKDVNDLVGDVGVTPGILWRRLLTRVDAALENRVPTSTELPALPSTLRDTVKRLSDAQLELFREWFPDGKGGINFPPFQRVFEQFTNGELRDPSVTGHLGFAEPGTGAFFLFAEFAFLCIELNFDKSDWEQALRTYL